MDPEKERRDWKFNETETLSAMLSLYVHYIENLKTISWNRFVLRQEFNQVAVSFISCMDRMVQCDEKLLTCVEKLSSHAEELSREVAALKRKLDGDAD